jgi:hypothetical protein
LGWPSRFRLAHRSGRHVGAATLLKRRLVDDLNVAERQSPDRPIFENPPNLVHRDMKARSHPRRTPTLNEEQ